MKKSRGWRKLMQIARHNVRFLCPLCDKPTPEGEAKLRSRGGSIVEPKHWLWTCAHCGATHRDGAEKVCK